MLPGSRIEVTRLLVALLLSLAPVTLAHLCVPSFRSVFISYPGSLPVLTELTLRFYPFAAALPLLVLVVWLSERSAGSRGNRSLGAGIACAMLAPVLLGIAMYLPILRMG